MKRPVSVGQDGGYLVSGCRMDSPRNLFCEKNWTPLVTEDGLEEYFVYAWGPTMQIGQRAKGLQPDEFGQRTKGLQQLTQKVASLPDEFGKRTTNVESCLEIVRTWPTESWPLFNKFRGSTPFQQYDKNTLVGVVHFSEQSTPRHYFHVLVWLEKNTFRPLGHSKCFYFANLGIEFCIGFQLSMNNMARFWISQFDHDPMCVELNLKTEGLESILGRRL